MITLKKYLELDPSKLSRQEEPPAEALLSAAVESYRSALAAMGDCGAQVCPAVGQELQQRLLELSEGMAKTLTPAMLRETEAKVEEQLQQWGGRTAEYFQQKAGEVKEMLLVMAQAAESVAERDQRHGKQFGEFTSRL